MKKKLLNCRGVGVELAILMMVVSFSMSILLTSVVLIQSTKKVQAEERLRQSIALEQLGQDFLSAVLKGDIENWQPGKYDGFEIAQQYNTCVCGISRPTGYTLTVYKTDKSMLNIRVTELQHADEEVGNPEMIEGKAVLKIVIHCDESTNTYKITEWTKNDRS